MARPRRATQSGSSVSELRARSQLDGVVVDYGRRGARVRAVAGATCGRARRDRRARRRVRLRQVDARPGRGRPRAADRRHGRLRGARRHAARAARRGPRSCARLQLVFQNPYASLNPRRKVGSSARRRPSGSARGSRLDAAHRRRRAAASSSALPATAAERLPARVLAAASASASRSPARSPPSPRCIVLDEPLASLDASAQAQIANLLVELVARARPRPAADLARPRDRPPRRRRGLGHVPRPDRRDRRPPAVWASRCTRTARR